MSENMKNARELEELIPLSVLALDHPEPIGGWEASGVELLEDDLGRPAIRREDARRLVEERREHDRRRTEEAARRQAELAAASPQISGGIRFPKDADPSMTAFEVMRAADAEAEQADPDRRVSPTEEFLTQRLGHPRSVDVTEE